MENLYSFIGDPEKEYLPHSVTESEFLERLEAKLYLENNLVYSIATEPIQNSQEYIHQSEEKVKQDCEGKAFVRLAEKIRKCFPRLPSILTADESM